MVKGQDFWVCGACGSRLAVRPGAIAAGLPLPPTFAQLPSVLAFPLGEYWTETHPVLRLIRLCDAAEILVRFLTIVSLGEVQRQHEGLLSEQVLRDIQHHIERPTFGEWRHMLATLVRATANNRKLVLPELPDFVSETLLPKMAGGDALPENSLMKLRDNLHHGGAMTQAAAREFLALWDPWFTSLVKEKLRFLEAIDVCFIGHEGEIKRLTGISTKAKAFTKSVELLGDLHAFQGHVVLLRGEHEERTVRFRSDCLLDLWPLHDYGRAVRPTLNGVREAPTESPLVYMRFERNRLLYAALGVDLPTGENQDVVETFLGLFRLRSRTTAKPDLLADFEAEIRADAAAFMGRSAELDYAKDIVKHASTGVFWITGPGGIGKSFLLAKLARDLGNAPKSLCRIAWRFKANDAARCNRFAFFRHAIVRVLMFLGKPDLAPVQDPNKLLAQLTGLLNEVAARPTTRSRSRPPRVLFILDGLDEIARLDPEFAHLPFTLRLQHVVWVCAGRQEGLLPQVFTPARCAHVFPDGLPFMSEDNIRAMLLDNTGALKYELFKCDTEFTNAWGDIEVVNTVVHTIVQRSGGLPLYIHFVIEDLLAGHFRCTELEQQLPRSLSEYYNDLLRRLSIGELQALLTPLVVTLAWARAPLQEETLRLLLVRRTAIGEGPHGRQVLQRALDALQSIVRLASTPHGQFGFELYHPTFRDHLQRDEAGHIGDQNVSAQMSFCELTRDWASLPEGPTRDYVLRHGPQHLIASIEAGRLGETGNRESLGKLLKDDEFWQARKRSLEIVEALLGTQDIAQALATHGVTYWQELYECAYRYCDLAETLRGDAQSLPQLINDGKIELACRLVDADPDPIRRGVFKLSVSMLLAGTNHEEEAGKLWNEGEELVGPDQPATDELMPRIRNPLHSFGPLTERLVRALLAKGAVAVRQAFGPSLPAQGAHQNDHIPTRHPQLGDAPPQSTIPLPFLVMGHLSVTRSFTFFLFFGLLFYVGVFGWGVVASLSSEQMDEVIHKALPFLVLPGFFFAFVFLSPLMRWVFWSCMDQRFAQLVQGFDAAIDRAPSATQKRVLLLRLVRFLARADLSNDSGRSFVDTKPWCPQVCELIARHMQPDVFAEAPHQAALVMLYGTAIGDQVCRAMINALGRFTPRQVEAVQGELLRQPLLMLGNRRLLKMIVVTAYQSPKPDLLFRFMRVNRELKSELGDDFYQPELAELPPVWLGTAILQSLSQREGSRWSVLVSRATDRFFNLLGNFVDYRTFVPFSDAERAIVLGFLAPPFILGSLFIHFLVNVYALFYVYDLIIGWYLLTGRLYDPHHFSRRASGTAREWRRRLLEELEPLSGSGIGVVMSRLATVEIRRLKTLVLAQEIVRGGLHDVLRGGLTTLDFASRKALSRALAALARNPELMAQRASVPGADMKPGPGGLPATILLQVMGDRVLLQGLQTYRPPPVRESTKNDAGLQRVSSGVEPLNNDQQNLDDSQDRQELLRLLPLQPRWWSLTWVTVLALAGTLVWLGGLWLLPTPEFHAFLWPYGVGTSLGICFYFAVLQHIPPLRFFELSEPTPGSPYGVGRGFIALIVIGWAEFKIWGWAEAAGVLRPGYDYGSDWVYAFSILSPLLIPNILVPELIARWRGAGLYYPTPSQLWRQRAVWTAVSLAGCLLLAALVSVAASGPSHSYARARASFEKAKSSFANGDYDSAIAQFDEALPLLDDAVAHKAIKHPVNAEAYWLRCWAHAQKEDLDKAIADCSVAIQREPDSERYLYRCWLYGRQDKLDLAIADCTEAAQRKELADAGLAEAYGKIAWLQLLAERPAKAIEAALKGLSIDPHQTWIKTNLAHGYLFDRQYAAASQMYVENKNVKINDRQMFAGAVLDDFKKFRERGIVPPDVEEELAKIESLMRSPN